MARNHPGDPLAKVRETNTAQRLAADYEPLSTWVGLAGNAMFFVGSVLFLWEASQLFGTWLFIFGALGMLIESVAGALRRSIDKAG